MSQACTSNLWYESWLSHLSGISQIQCKDKYNILYMQEFKEKIYYQNKNL
jgi:hypothetical protein